jgi:hypothetical protein
MIYTLHTLIVTPVDGKPKEKKESLASEKPERRRKTTNRNPTKDVKKKNSVTEMRNGNRSNQKIEKERKVNADRLGMNMMIGMNHLDGERERVPEADVVNRRLMTIILIGKKRHMNPNRTGEPPDDPNRLRSHVNAVERSS